MRSAEQANDDFPVIKLGEYDHAGHVAAQMHRARMGVRVQQQTKWMRRDLNNSSELKQARLRRAPGLLRGETIEGS